MSGAVNYQNSAQSTAGNISVASNANGLQSVAGQLDLPGTKGGTAKVTISAQRFWLFQFWTGTVTISDPTAGVSVSAPIFGGLNRGASAHSAAGVTSWFRFGQFPNVIQPYNLSWSVDDIS